VRKGRPLDKVLIMMAGQSGTGKSTTINRLFQDDQLCTVSESRSETSEVHQCTKTLAVRSVNPAISSSLTFVDVPGSLDTDSRREALNQTKILYFRKNEMSLKSRSVPLKYKALGISEKVYPNLVLFVFNSMEKRMDGPDSNLRKSLKMLLDTDIVDRKHPNILVVGTHAGSLPRNRTKFTERTALVTKVIEDAVHQVLGIPKVVNTSLSIRPLFNSLLS
jgi:predicted GTPase